MMNTFQDFAYMPMQRSIQLAEAYVPYQQYTTSYTPQVALEKGTMFPDLYRPYRKRRY